MKAAINRERHLTKLFLAKALSLPLPEQAREDFTPRWPHN